jgi:predicted nuclease of predicted toxin-antitoxin system
MRILIDECLPAGLKNNIAALGHECQTVREAGFGAKKNGELLTLAESGWDLLLTSDRNIKYQQNMTGRKVSILILCAKSNRMKDCCR